MKNPHAKVWVLAGNGRQKHGLDFHYKIPKSGTWLILAPVWHQELSSKSKSQVQVQGFAMNIRDRAGLGPVEFDGRFATAHQKMTSNA